jgi:hypothetical protein
MSNPFAPLASGPQSEWTARDHQNAANFYFHERMGANEEEAGPNYKPLWSGMDAAWRYHTRQAHALRQRA